MNKGLWIARKNHLICIVKKLSDGHGGDEKEWLNGHCIAVLEMYPGDDIEIAIKCYEECIKDLRYYRHRRKSFIDASALT